MAGGRARVFQGAHPPAVSHIILFNFFCYYSSQGRSGYEVNWGGRSGQRTSGSTARNASGERLLLGLGELAQVQGSDVHRCRFLMLRSV